MKYLTSKLSITLALLLLCLQATTARSGQRRRPSSSSSQRADSDDLYAILGLKKSAKKKDIKSAYRKLALKYHPDKVPEEEKEAAEDKFVRISEAYRILGNEELKGVYDQYGKNGLDAFEKGQDPKMAGMFFLG